MSELTKLKKHVQHLIELQQKATKGPLAVGRKVLASNEIVTTTQNPDLHWTGRDSLIGNFYLVDDALFTVELINSSAFLLPIIDKLIDVAQCAMSHGDTKDTEAVINLNKTLME